MRKSLLYKILILITSLLFCTIYLNSCTKITEYREAKNREEKLKKEKEFKESQQNSNETFFREEAVLLSIKYKLDEDKVFNILVETQGFNPENIQGLLEGNSITRTQMVSIAEKYGIPIDILASILIDYYSMQPCEH